MVPGLYTSLRAGFFYGCVPTGKCLTVMGMTTFRIVGGKRVAHWGEIDTMGIMQQLGLVPVPAQVG